MPVEVNIVPNSAWDPNKKELLGVSIRFCNIRSATEYVWHIMVRGLSFRLFVTHYLLGSFS